MIQKLDEKMDKEIFIKKLQVLGNANRASADQRYHKSNRVHWGISVPVCDKLTKTLCKQMSEQELIALAKELWTTNLFDPMVSFPPTLCYFSRQKRESPFDVIVAFSLSIHIKWF